MSRRLHRALTVGSICMVAVITPASATAQHAAPLFREWSAIEASGWQTAQFTQVTSPAPDSLATRIVVVSSAFSFLAYIPANILLILRGWDHYCGDHAMLCYVSLPVLVPAGMSSLAGAHFFDGVLGSAIGTSTFFLLGNDLLRAVAAQRQSR